MRPETRARHLLLAGLTALLLITLWQWRGAAPVSSDLLALLPSIERDALREQAETRMQAAMNRELVLLIGHPHAEQARALAKEQAAALHATGLFESVQWRTEADVRAFGEELLRGRLALPSQAQRQLLIDAPQEFIEQRAQALLSPLQTSPVALERDWLGLAADAALQLQRLAGKVRPDPTIGALEVEGEGQRWVLLRLRTRADAFALDQAPTIAARLDQAQLAVRAAGGELLATGGLLFAAQAQQSAAQEISWLGGGAALGVVLLLLVAFRSHRALLALVPVVAGLGMGVAACIGLFGQIHLITLVLGGSLIGVAIDYPLHVLAKRWTLVPWDAARALRLTLPGLTLSLLSSLIGYLALAFSPFPALTQIAVFSAAGLLAAYAATLVLAPLMATEHLRPWPVLLALASRLEAARERLLGQARAPLLGALLLVITVAGLSRLTLDNDLRQWVTPSPALLEAASRVGALTGHQPTSQFFLVEGRDEDELLARQAALAARLDGLVERGVLGGYLALSQRLATPQAQERLRQAIEQLPAHWQPLLALGIPPAALETERQTLLALPAQGIDATLQSPGAEPWRALWLGRQGEGVAGLITLRGLRDAQPLAALTEGLDGVRLVDRVAALNQTFAETQWRAGELKLISCALIVGLLALVVGWWQSLRIILLPLLACGLALAVLAWTGQPLTLLGLFGLLLVCALGVDYAILMHEQVGGAPVSLLGVLLSGLTTWLSFGLLAFSSTPAVADFGLTVSLGLLFCVLLAPWANPRPVHLPLTEAPA